jgi:hypothetical protein
MRRRNFLATPLLLPLLARAAAMETPVAYPPVTPGRHLNFRVTTARIRISEPNGGT